MTDTPTPTERMKDCPFCSEPIKYDAKKCRHCGETIDVALRMAEDARRGSGSSNQPMVFMNAGGGGGAAAAAASGGSGPSGGSAKVGTKSKTMAGILAIFLGGIGMHKFYLGKAFQGLIYLLLCWTGIPVFIGFFEGLSYLMMSEAKFAEKYG